MKVETQKRGLSLPWLFWKNGYYSQGTYIFVNIKRLYIVNYNNRNTNLAKKTQIEKKQHSVTNCDVDWRVCGAF